MLDDQRDLPGDERVARVIRAINGYRRSLFSYGIMSGEQEAVNLIYDLVAGREETAADGTRTHHPGVFGEDHDEVVMHSSRASSYFFFIHAGKSILLAARPNDASLLCTQPIQGEKCLPVRHACRIHGLAHV